MTEAILKLQRWLLDPEGERLEFKEAKNRYDFQELAQYCAALSNEGGGAVILGVSDKRPRKVVGTRAFPQSERTRRGLVERLHLRVDFEEIAHPDGRVLVFTVPSRPMGSPLKDLLQVLPSLSGEQVKTLLRELKAGGKAHPVGTTRATRWFPGPGPDGIGAGSAD
ncbi:MAG: AlbA family DNA-binding domain-containing protein [Planctomycetota bacterium]